MDLKRMVRKIWVLIIFLVSIPSFATIEPIFSIAEIKISEAEENQTLFVFDIDDTLTILKEPAFQRPNFKTYHFELFAQLMDSLSLKERAVAFTLPLFITPGELIEPDSPINIQKLQRIGVRAIGLTAAMGGEIESVSVEDRRIDELYRVGIDFSNSFFDLSEVSFPIFKTPIYGKHPVFKKGILFTNENDKGRVLIEFLKIISWKPKQIIFVDDRLDHLYAVEKALLEYDSEICYQGFHFQTDPSCYQSVDGEVFEKKWAEVVAKAQKILSEEKLSD